MWSAVVRTSLHRRSVVRIRPWRISSVVSERIIALRWSAGRLSFLSLLAWRIIVTAGARAAGARAAGSGAMKAPASARSAAKRARRSMAAEVRSTTSGLSSSEL